MISSRRKFIKAITLHVLLCSITPLYAVTPWLHTDGNLIKDPFGNTVVLRGIDMMDLAATQYWYGGATAMIDRLTNQNDPCGNSPGWYTKVVRLAIMPKDASDGTWPLEFNPDNPNDSNTTSLYNLLRSVVDYCKTKDIYVIIDWHYVANTYDKVASTSAFWTYMAPKFAGDSHVLFELFNEPINDINGDWIFNSNDVADWLSVRTDMQTWINIVRTYAPNNLILVAGAAYSQIIAPAVTYPLTGDNIVIVSHIYPGHWLDSYWSSSYKAQINGCLNRYPVFMSEWGFYNAPGDSLHYGSITNYGQPLMDFREARKIGNTAWIASYDWIPSMFTGSTSWKLRIGENEMGGFTKDKLYEKKDADQPSVGDPMSPAVPTGLSATGGEQVISLDWNDNNELDLSGYNVYRSTISGSGYVKLNSSYLTASNYTDSSVSGYVTYYYVVTAIDTLDNESFASDEAFAAATDATSPSTPTGLTASGDNHTISLDWNNNPEPDINGYNVYRSTTSGSDYIKINSSLLSNSDYVDNSVINGRTYYYVVTAVDTSSNESGYSSQFSAQPHIIVDMLGSWISGNNHPKEPGNNRALLFFVYAEYSNSGVSLNYVDYGGRMMTRVAEQYLAGTSDRVYVAAFILNDANIVAADSSGLFIPNWTGTPTGFACSSVFFGNVNQATPIAASAGGSGASNPTITAELPNKIGDIVLLGITASTTGTFTLNNGFAKISEYGMTASDSADGYKFATGAPETPSVTFSSTAARKVIIGLVVNAITSEFTGDGSGSVLSEWWTDIPGTAISDLTSDINYPNNPAGRELLTAFEGPINWDENYGVRMRGYLYPPVDGNYTFLLTSDADSQLWLSTDDTPANKALIASVSGSGSQQSSLISLFTGQKYYIEVLHKEGTGDDSISVSWEGPGLAQQIIDGIYLSPAALQFEDYSGFAGQWHQTGCNAGNEWCYGFDFTRDGSVQLDDLEKFAESWLLGIE